MNKKAVLILFAVVAVLTTALFLVSKPSKSSTPPPIDSESKQSADITLSLPGAKPIPAIAEDYNLPSSLWVIVSKTHPLANVAYAPEHFSPPAVSLRQDKTTEEKSLRNDIHPATKELFDAAKTAGFDLMLASGYRSYELQQTYFTSYAKAYGEEAASKFSARPGQSEHQTGLAFDISYTSRECYLDICFGETEAGKWIAAHSYEYGFIVRYPKDKTEITQYQYEPWHLRYVGIELATALHDSNLTLDEAYQALQSTRTKLLNQGKI
jgi:D-alanyl-D-alanine carboxypeptidase